VVATPSTVAWPRFTTVWEVASRYVSTWVGSLLLEFISAAKSMPCCLPIRSRSSFSHGRAFGIDRVSNGLRM
jgi:hypothetical protein